MKIGILTLPLHQNYGGILQAYALQKYLTARGHQPWLINISHGSSFEKRIIKEILKAFIKKTQINLDRKIIRFINKSITPKTRFIELERDQEKIKNYNFQAYIVGSDQVWREEYCRNIKKKFFLDFTHNDPVKRIAYAASFGVDTWDYSPAITNDLSKLIKKFDGISVREDSAVNLCKKKLGINATVLVDPTMLLDIAEYKNLISSNSNSNRNSNKLVTYILDHSLHKEKIINHIVHETGYQIHSISNEKKNFLNFRKSISISKWLKGFESAQYVVTDSFHGCIFSILFNKPFIAIGNKKRGITRFKSLLEIFNLNNRLIYDLEDINTPLIQEELDWKEINKILAVKKKETDEFFELLNM